MNLILGMMLEAGGSKSRCHSFMRGMPFFFFFFFFQQFISSFGHMYSGYQLRFGGVMLALFVCFFLVLLFFHSY